MPVEFGKIWPSSIRVVVLTNINIKKSKHIALPKPVKLKLLMIKMYTTLEMCCPDMTLNLLYVVMLIFTFSQISVICHKGKCSQNYKIASKDRVYHAKN